MRRINSALVAGLSSLLMVAGLAAAAPQPGGDRRGSAVSAAEDATTPGYACRQDLFQYDQDRLPHGAHVAGIAEAPSGDLLFHFDGNTDEVDDDRPDWTVARAFLSRMEVGSNDWTFPEMIPYEEDDDAAHNTVLFNDGTGRIHNFFTTREGPSHADSTLDYRYSDDDGHEWSPAERIREEHGWMFGTRPFRMSNGEAIVPVYKEAAPWGVGFFISDDNFESWSTHPLGDVSEDLIWPTAFTGGIQAATVELSQPGHLLAYVRSYARTWATRSFDYGRTWTQMEPTQFDNPWSRVDLLRTNTGELLLAYNDSTSGRTPLRIAMSEDEGLTWPYEVTVENDPDHSFAYPWLYQSKDGAIHLGYTHPRGKMRHVVFDEDFVRSGATIDSDLDPNTYEYRNGTLRQVDECAYHAQQGLPDLGAPYACRQDIHPQDQDFPGVHVAALEEAPNGDLLYAFYAGSREKATDVQTYMSRLPGGSNRWTAPRVVFDEPDKPDGNAVLWTDDENDRIHLFFSTIMDDGWTEANLRAITSEDNGETWSEPRWVREEWGWLFGTLPFRMSNGELLVPIYSETEWSSGFYVSDDDGYTFTAYPNDDDTTWPTSLGGMIQPATVELEDGHLLALNRSRDRFIWKTESFDYGRTWTDAVPTDLPNNNSRVALLKLDNGNLVLAYNPTRSGRTPLRLALSTDGGQTWPNWVDVETEPGEEFSYPYLLQGSDGMIHLGYTHRRESMRHVAFNEAFLRHGTTIPSDGDFDTVYEFTPTTGLKTTDACAYTAPVNREDRGSEQADDVRRDKEAPYGRPFDQPYACRQDVHGHNRDFPGEYVHVASITQAPNGDLLYGFVGGAHEKDPATKRTYMSRLKVGESSWDPVEVLLDTPDKPDGNAVLWHDGKGRVWNFFSTIQGAGWSEADLGFMWSDDSGVTWSEPAQMRSEQGWNVGTAPLRMSNGETLLPIYDERFGTSGFYISDDDWQSWKSHPGAPAGPEVEPLGHAFAATWPRGIQASTVELDPGHLLAYMRSSSGSIMVSESTDYGRTWSPSTASEHPNPGARVALLKLDNGNLLLASNPVDGDAPERSPMTVALSEDNGATWPWSVEVETNRDERMQYPFLMQDDQGMIHLGYTHARRTKNMRHVVFNEAFVRQGAHIESNPASGRRAYEDKPIPVERVEYRDGAFQQVETCSWSLAPADGK